MEVIPFIIYHHLSIIFYLVFHRSLRLYHFQSYIYMRVYTSVYLNYKFQGFHNTDSLQTMKFSSAHWFATDNKIQKRTLIHCRQHNLTTNIESLHTIEFWQQTLICYRQHKFSAANTNPLQTTRFWQQTLIRCIQHNLGSER